MPLQCPQDTWRGLDLTHPSNTLHVRYPFCNPPKSVVGAPMFGRVPAHIVGRAGPPTKCPLLVPSRHMEGFGPYPPIQYPPRSTTPLTTPQSVAGAPIFGGVPCIHRGLSSPTHSTPHTPGIYRGPGPRIPVRCPLVRYPLWPPPQKCCGGPDV
jgi:hypothetical protein